MHSRNPSQDLLQACTYKCENVLMWKYMKKIDMFQMLKKSLFAFAQSVTWPPSCVYLCENIWTQGFKTLKNGRGSILQIPQIIHQKITSDKKTNLSPRLSVRFCIYQTYQCSYELPASNNTWNNIFLLVNGCTKCWSS